MVCEEKKEKSMEKDILDRIEVLQGDITCLDVDAIVNAANRSLLGGGGVDGAIHRAAGPDLLAECRAIGGCPTGKAKITRGYNLIARHVIHTVGPVYSGKQSDSHLLSQCYANCLQLAIDQGISTIAFPAVSCGVYGYPMKAACKIAVDSTCNVLKDSRSINRVVFELFSTGGYNIYRDYLSTIAD